MATYNYNNHKTGETIQVKAKDILKADKIYEKITSLNASKCMYIGIEILKGG